MTLSRFKMMLAVCLTVPLLASCGNTGNDDCIGFSPVYIAKADQLTDGTARQILANNKLGKKRCKWANAHT